MNARGSWHCQKVQNIEEKNLPVWGLELRSANSQLLTIITEPKYRVVASTAWPLWLLVFGVSIPKRDAHTYIYIYATQNSVPIMCLALRRLAMNANLDPFPRYGHAIYVYISS